MRTAPVFLFTQALITSSAAAGMIADARKAVIKTTTKANLIMIPSFSHYLCGQAVVLLSMKQKGFAVFQRVFLNSILRSHSDFASNSLDRRSLSPPRKSIIPAGDRSQ
jgi:hypothetical protein